MSLVSNTFLLFVALAALLYYLVPAKAQWVVLLIFSYLYYVSGSARYLFFILYSTVVIYAFALWLDRLNRAEAEIKVRKRVAALGLVLNFGMLGAVKYTNFLVESLDQLLHLHIPGIAVLFPLGISFYTFQSSGYLLDVYWKKAKPERNFFKFALFVSFFPQLLQGPIGNFNRLAPQLTAPHRPELGRICRALERILWGFAKKMIIADWAGVFADAIWGDLEAYRGLALFGVLFYGIQLYADFSGAIDVVIGIGQIFGITMDENFRQPYLATSIADFWKRWHITLGQWMMNYVFYPLNLSNWLKDLGRACRKRFGKRMGRVIPIAIADLIVFFLVGVWHGANWTFLIYGLINGGIIAFSQLMGDTYKSWKKALHISGKEGWYHVFMILRTFLLVSFCWFFDRSESVGQAARMIRLAFTQFAPAQLLEIPSGSQGTAFVPWALLIIAVGCVIMLTVGILRERGTDVAEKLNALPLPAVIAIFLLLFVCIGLFGCTAAPRGFIYAQF